MLAGVPELGCTSGQRPAQGKVINSALGPHYSLPATILKFEEILYKPLISVVEETYTLC